MPELIDNIIAVDKTGQFVVSTARYLNAIDAKKYADSIDKLVKVAIEKDRERVYLGDLAASIWGPDYKEHAAELSAAVPTNCRPWTIISAASTSGFIRWACEIARFFCRSVGL